MKSIRTLPTLPVVVTGLAASALSLLWYSPLLFGDIWITLSAADPSAMPTWKMMIAPLRELLTASVLAYLIVRLAIVNWKSAASLGFGLWLAFHAVQMAGAVIWDNMPWKLGAVHAGDWLMKMLFITIALTLWLRRESPSLSRRRAEG
jgi:hypothetical protein